MSMHNDLKRLFVATEEPTDPHAYIKSEEKRVRALHERATIAEQFVLTPGWKQLEVTLSARVDAMKASWSPLDAPQVAVAAMAGVRALEFSLRAPYAEIEAYRSGVEALKDAKVSLGYSEPDPELDVS